MTNQSNEWPRSVRLSMEELRDYATELDMVDFGNLSYEDLTAAVIEAQKKKLESLGLGDFPL